VHFDRLEVSWFRNLTSLTVELNPGLNFFFGANGAGKTAILEAVHLLGRGRSFRTNGARSLVQHGGDRLTVRSVIHDEFRGMLAVAMSKDSSGHTDLKINGMPERRLSAAARLIPLQVMLPDIAELVFGSPQLRRQWLDWGTFHVEPDYLRHLRKYLRALRQRNAALKTARADLSPWTAQLVDAAECIDAQRANYLRGLLPEFNEVMSRLAPELSVQMSYRRGWPDDESLHKVLGECAPREVRLGATQAGPHRADIELRADDSRASAVLSRGQGKVVASALKVSQARLLASSAKRGSVFLIDDVGAELDETHNSRFFEMLDETGSQILATSIFRPTARSRFSEDRMSTFHVEHGQCIGA
jgi:DNA replication and repair protein RecF